MLFPSPLRHRAAALLLAIAFLGAAPFRAPLAAPPDAARCEAALPGPAAETRPIEL